MHFDEASRGFSWLRDGPLDMRFNRLSGTKTAADVLNTFSEHNLAKVRTLNHLILTFLIQVSPFLNNACTVDL